MSDEINIRVLRAAINAELDDLEQLELHAIAAYQIRNEIASNQQRILEASNNPDAIAMGAALKQIEKGLDDVHFGIEAFRGRAVFYLRFLS